MRVAGPSNDGKRLLSGGADGQVRVWAISKGTQVMIASMKEHKGPVYAISIKVRRRPPAKSHADMSNAVPDATDLVPESFVLLACSLRCAQADDTECVSASADGSCITWSLTDAAPFVRVNALFAANFFKSVVYHPCVAHGPQPQPLQSPPHVLV